jgi:trimeric autotransporter adhesin
MKIKSVLFLALTLIVSLRLQVFAQIDPINVVNQTPLESTAGSQKEVARFRNDTGNSSMLRLFFRRHAEGTNWNSAETKLQAFTDATPQGFITFNPGIAPNGVIIGTKSVNTIITMKDDGNINLGTSTSQVTVIGNQAINGSLSVNGNLSMGGSSFINSASGLKLSGGLTSTAGSIDLNSAGGLSLKANSTLIPLSILSTGAVNIGTAATNVSILGNQSVNGSLTVNGNLSMGGASDINSATGLKLSGGTTASAGSIDLNSAGGLSLKANSSLIPLSILSTGAVNIGTAGTEVKIANDLNVVGNFIGGNDLILGGTNSWIQHTPNDGRTSMFLAPKIGAEWAWGKGTELFNNGNVKFSGKISTMGMDPNANFGYPQGWAGGILSWDIYAAGSVGAPNFYASGADKGISFYGGGERIIGTKEYGIEFQTANNTARISLLNNGKVGIGTKTPGHSLEVLGLNEVAAFSSHGSEAYVRVWANSGGGINERVEFANRGFGRAAIWVPGVGDALIVGRDGKVMIREGVLTSRVKVAVKDGVNWNWADYVFDSTYTLKTLDQVENYIKANHHLEGIPTSEEVKQDGIDIAPITAKLLEKIEELTLYMIELKKENTQQALEISKLKSEFTKSNK